MNHDFAGLLRSLYEALAALTPATYRFDQRGQALWRAWHIDCEKYKVSEPNLSLRVLYPKSKERAARIALVVHCINAVVAGRVPDPIIPGTLLEAAIAFTQWSIGQTRLIYADAGAVSHAETAKIVRFVERFRNADWVTARTVTWWSATTKPKAEAVRTFMRQVVDLGHAIDDGKTGKDYAIRIQEKVDHSDNKTPQTSASVEVEHGNKSGNSPVTTDNDDNDKAAMVPEPALRIDHSLGSAPDDLNIATEQPPLKGSSDKLSGAPPVTLLPTVTSFVTTPKAAPAKASRGICYPVTSTELHVGDRVVLTREGINRPSEELQAIWTVKTMHHQYQKVVIHYEIFGDRAVPLDWLERYERVAKSG